MLSLLGITITDHVMSVTQKVSLACLVKAAGDSIMLGEHPDNPS